MSDPLLYEQQGHVVTLTFNRPEARNPMSGDDMIDAVVDATERINRDWSVRAVILTGAGSAFCAGGNIKDMKDKSGVFGGSPAEIREGYRRGIQRIPLAINEMDVPIIAAVNGAAVGAGCDIATMCDIRIASESAFFAESFVKVGLIPGDGGAWFLPRVIGMSRACEMAFTGDRVDARTALEWGLVSRVVPGDQLMAAARELAARITVNPPTVVRMTKRLLREGQRMDLRSLLELSAPMQSLAHYTDEHHEAVSAMVEKRSPNFSKSGK
jgi:enoyl-CoA hydratase/carnithine racemase